MRDLLRRDLKQVELQSEPEIWWAEAMECYCFLRDVQDLLADGQTPHERRFNSPFDVPIIPLGAEVKFYHFSAKDQGRVHQFRHKVPSWNIHRVRVERGEGEVEVGLVIYL